MRYNPATKKWEPEEQQAGPISDPGGQPNLLLPQQEPLPQVDAPTIAREQEADPIMSALVGPGEYKQPYGEDKFLNPRRMMWAGLLKDLGTQFGSWTGSTFARTPVGGAMQGAMDARNYNNRLTAANQAAQRQHRQDQNQYSQQMYQRMHTDRQFDAQQQARELAQQNTEFTQGIQQATLDETLRKNQVAEGLALRQFEQKLANTGKSPEDLKAAMEQRKEFEKNTEAQREVAANGRAVVTALSQGTGSGDLAGIIKFYKNLDPGSVVSGSEANTLAEAGGLIEKLKNYGDKVASGSILGEGARQDIAQTVAALTKLAEEDYTRQREETESRLLNYSTLAPERVIGSQPYNFEIPQYQQAPQTNATTGEVERSPTHNRPWLRPSR